MALAPTRARVLSTAYRFLVSDVVAVGLTTGAVGLAGSVVTYLIARHQAAVEIAKLRLQHSEDERRHRQGVYHQLLEVIQRRNFYLTKGDITPDQAESIRAQLDHLEPAIDLFGSPEVAKAVSDYGRAIWAMQDTANRLAQDAGLSATGAAYWHRAWKQHASELHEREQDIIDAMRADIGHTRELAHTKHDP